MVNRSTYWDTIKAILIFLVVLGHTGTAMGNNNLSVIYAFHMPLFLLVSGFFAKKKPVNNFRGGVIKLLIIYLLFHFMYLILDCVIGVNIDLNRILTPSFSLWYILALLYYKVVIQYVPQRVLRHTGTVLLLSFIISIGAGFIPLGSQLSFQRACTFFPFFMIGYYVNQNGWFLKIRNMNKYMAMMVLILLSLSCYMIIPVFYGYSVYVTLVNDAFMKIIHLSIAILMCISIMVIVPDKLGRFTNIGKYTLMIYLIHPPMIKMGKVVCEKLGYEMGVLGAILLTIITICSIYYVRNLKLLQYLK